MDNVPSSHKLTKPRSWFAIFRAFGGVFAIISAVICLFITIFSISTYRTADSYDRIGVVTEAQAASRRTSTDSDGDISYYVTFFFEASEQVVERERSVPSSIFYRAEENALLEIRYLPETPEKFETYVGQARKQGKIAQIAAGVTGLMGLFVLWRSGGQTNQAVLARKLGQRAVAVVESVAEVKKSGKYTGKAHLIWTTSDGLRGKSLIQRMSKLSSIDEGSEINVYIRKGYSVWEGDVGPRDAG